MKQLLTIVIFILATNYLFGQEIAPNNVPHLNGHYFVPNSTTPSPFTNSTLSSTLGVAQSAEFVNELVNLAGASIVGMKAKLFFAHLEFSYQQRVREWVAVYIKTGLTARLGSETEGVISQGVNTVMSTRVGWLIKIIEKPKYMLSGSIQINNHSATFVNVSAAVEDYYVDSVLNTSVVSNVPIFIGNVGLRFAYGISELFGLVAFAEYGYGDSYKRGVSDNAYRFGGMFDVNLYPRTSVPLGFTLFYNNSLIPDLIQVENKAASNMGFKFAYTGGTNFNAGLEISNVQIPVPNVKDKVQSSSFMMVMVYFFN